MHSVQPMSPEKLPKAAALSLPGGAGGFEERGEDATADVVEVFVKAEPEFDHLTVRDADEWPRAGSTCVEAQPTRSLKGEAIYEQVWQNVFLMS